jgi:hypothetical protein
MLLFLAVNGFAQERRGKTRISNAGFTITALPLLAAKEWGVFTANGVDMEIILMQSALVPAALTQGDIDYQAGVGPASVNATLSGFATRAIWFSSEPRRGVIQCVTCSRRCVATLRRQSKLSLAWLWIQ